MKNEILSSIKKYAKSKIMQGLNTESVLCQNDINNRDYALIPTSVVVPYLDYVLSNNNYIC